MLCAVLTTPSHRNASAALAVSPRSLPPSGSSSRGQLTLTMPSSIPPLLYMAPFGVPAEPTSEDGSIGWGPSLH